jgi:ureidoacrylate peracid hydrolase
MDKTNAEQSGSRGGTATYLSKGQETVAFPPSRTALLVIDPVNDFLSEGGAGYEMTKSTLKMVGVIENLKRALEGARERGIPVLYGPMAYTEEDYKEHQLHRRSSINRVMFEHKMFLAGSWGADFHPDLQPQDGDIVLLPHKTCDVYETDLPEHLERLGITHLVIAGMTANLCCESTGRHAMERGYDVTFLSDAIGSTSVPSYEASIHINFPMLANGIMKAEEFLEAIDAAAEARVTSQKGDTILGSDHGEIGTVKEIVPASPGTEGYLLVPRGIIFKTDTYIPLEAVVRRSADTVFINVPKLVVGTMPWSEPPTKATTEEKCGPPAGEVDKLYGSRAPTRHGAS